jgi:DNA gyrase subunit A
LIEKIAELVNEKKLDGISEIRDESNREGIRVVIELKRDAVPQVVLNKLYKLTPLQMSFGIINIAIVDGQPKVLNLKQMLEAFVEFRREVVRRRTEFELRKAQARAHILEGLQKAIDALDYIIPLIRNSRSTDEARAWLTGNFATLDEQKTWRGAPADKNSCGIFEGTAQSRWRSAFYRYSGTGDSRFAIAQIVGARTSENHRRTGGDYEIHRRARSDLANDQLLRQVIVDELQEVKKNFGDARRTEIVDAGASSCESKI